MGKRELTQKSGTGVRSYITRGLGERQKKESISTKHRIIGHLYTQPYTYQQLWKATKIHKNAFTSRLDELVKDNTVIKHRYTFPDHRGKYTGHNFYLLNWAKKQSKEIASLIFDKELTRDNPISVMKKNCFLEQSYKINSIQVEPSKKEYAIVEIGEDRSLRPRYIYDISRHEFEEKIRELCMREQDIMFHITNAELHVEEINKLVEKRDSILESIILLCTFFCVKNYLVRDDDTLSPYDMLVFFTTISLFNYWCPYVKFFEIMQRIGY